MTSRGDIAPLNPEGYPLETAFYAVDLYTAMQNGEPQLIVFGDTVSHYAFVSRSKPSAMFPRREPVLIESYDTVGQMADTMSVQAQTDMELDPYRQQVIGMLKAVFGDRPEELPLTTAGEMEREAFELSCLDLDEIREAAKHRAAAEEDPDVPTLTMVNNATGESHDIVLDAATLIADGRLELTRRSEKRGSSNDVTVKTDILLG
ncbi:MAG TPA: hypothetical protein VN554_01745, partial [Verrucomicrobiae bacterium]|nr:hypothetical protein [Verrucomicrobiae bacterium]